MALPVAPKLEVHPGFRPFLAMAEAVLLKTNEVAEHLRYTPHRLHLARRVPGAGPAFLQLPTGAVRYRMSEVLEFELLGNSAHLTVDRVIMAAATMPDVTPEFLASLEQHLKATLYTNR